MNVGDCEITRLSKTRQYDQRTKFPESDGGFNNPAYGFNFSELGMLVAELIPPLHSPMSGPAR